MRTQGREGHTEPEGTCQSIPEEVTCLILLRTVGKAFFTRLSVGNVRADELRIEDWNRDMFSSFLCCWDLFLSLKPQERTTPLKLASKLCERQ